VEHGWSANAVLKPRVRIPGINKKTPATGQGEQASKQACFAIRTFSTGADGGGGGWSSAGGGCGEWGW
jgi:hypothetical protein